VPQLSELYKQVVLDHNRTPRHFAELAPPCTHLEAFNPFCGDKLDLFLRDDEHRLVLSFTGVGCALSQASASMMMEALQGFDPDAASELIERFIVAASGDQSAEELALPGDLSALLEARRFPSRVNCVLLGWQELGKYLQAKTCDHG